MPRFVDTVKQAFAGRGRAWRRALNLRAGRASGRAAPASASDATPAFWLSLAALLSAIAGAALIAGHARRLDTAASGAGGGERSAAVFQPALPGLAFDVPDRPALTLTAVDGGTLLIAAGTAPSAPVRVDLCSQLDDPGHARLAPLRVGYHFDDVRRWIGAPTPARPPALRNVLLLADGTAGPAMPEVTISGMAVADFSDPQSQPLMLNWRGGSEARWIGDASGGRIERGASAQVGLRQHGWLLWGRDAALRIERRPSAACPQAGELLLQLMRLRANANANANVNGQSRALVAAFPARGQPVTSYLAAGPYRVPAAPPAGLEDQTLFLDLQARGLVRLSAAGQAELAPRDLAQWAAAAPAERAVELAGWSGVRLDPAAVRLLKRVYHQADGAYVRQQIDIFNGEQHLLAWRARNGSAAAWQIGAGAMPLAATGQMPASAARLFADLPQGWAPWSRLAQWPQADARAPSGLTLTLPLAQAATGSEQYELLLIGRAGAVSGARLRAQPACSGRACPAPDAVQHLLLQALPGARALHVGVQPLAAAALNGRGERQYRHLRVAAGQLVWQPLPAAQTQSAARAPSPVRLYDRHDTLLWADGGPTQAARDAGLAPLLGLNAGHASSVAGMLGRLPLPASGRLSLDLALQALSQHALDCIGLRRGRWDGRTCSGGQPVPEGRRAGLVLLDAENGDVLAAAGAGGAAVSAANWNEVRDFDQANPARSPLRLPALQHDGGAHQSPGSTFKVVSALGLEMAARSDARIDALLEGLPLEAINRQARERGFGFQTGAAVYPLAAGAHITNYREQSLDRRARDGRLGLAQALTYSLNTWFAWTGELSDRSLFGRAEGGAPDLQPLDPAALDALRPIVGAAHRLGFEQPLRLDGGLLPADFSWGGWDALQATPSHIDPIHTRHELRQMAIGLRMQATPLQMALAAAAIGQGGTVPPRLLLELDGAASRTPAAAALDVRLDRIRAGMKGVVDAGTGAAAFAAPALAPLRRGLYGKTGTAPTSVVQADGSRRELATVWFTGWLEPGSLPGQTHRLAMAAFISHSDASGGEHAAPVVAALLSGMAGQNREQKAKGP